MVAPVEIITIACLVAIAGSVKVAATEFARVRKQRQMREALRLALGNLA
jgi:hypothetical protein